MELTRIHPDHARIQVADAAAVLRQEAEPRADRPHLALNFAATLDGRITIGGRSGPIGNEVDRELFHELRAQVDAVMVGAGTAGTERYGRIVRDPDRRERRRAAGLEPDPLAVIVSARLSLGPDLPLLQDESSRVVIITASDQALEGVRAQVEYLRPSDAPATPEDLTGRAAMLPRADRSWRARSCVRASSMSSSCRSPRSSRPGRARRWSPARRSSRPRTPSS